MKPPKYIRDYRRAIADEFDVAEDEVDRWAKEGLEIFGKMKNSEYEFERELYKTISRLFLPAYHVGVQRYIFNNLLQKLRRDPPD